MQGISALGEICKPTIFSISKEYNTVADSSYAYKPLLVQQYFVAFTQHVALSKVTTATISKE